MEFAFNTTYRLTDRLLSRYTRESCGINRYIASYVGKTLWTVHEFDSYRNVKSIRLCNTGEIVDSVVVSAGVYKAKDYILFTKSELKDGEILSVTKSTSSEDAYLVMAYLPSDGDFRHKEVDNRYTVSKKEAEEFASEFIKKNEDAIVHIFKLDSIATGKKEINVIFDKK